jgi:hypothetical protein
VLESLAKLTMICFAEAGKIAGGGEKAGKAARGASMCAAISTENLNEILAGVRSAASPGAAR